MQQPTKTKHSEQLNIQENAENNHNKQSSLIEREKIEGTPFTLIKLNEQWFMVMGDYRITEETKTKEEQIKKLETEKWLIIMHLAVIVVQKIYAQTMEYNKTINELKKEQETKTYETESL